MTNPYILANAVEKRVQLQKWLPGSPANTEQVISHSSEIAKEYAECWGKTRL
jgi:hypothetical protein